MSARARRWAAAFFAPEARSAFQVYLDAKWEAASERAANMYPLCAKCGHTYVEHARIHACGKCLCDGYAGRTL